ncbi:uncharacterized protein M6B38_402330 [Iris pallida]|uniref:NADH dehydrogenase subunit 6 n=1 Tax=Iris pallida TaxID=29817 RepID=A0AAX6FTF3_IRIPA|nr:uncharacterized protein M6B38_402330 [Iris pallida]
MVVVGESQVVIMATVMEVGGMLAVWLMSARWPMVVASMVLVWWGFDGGVDDGRQGKG